MIAIGNLLAEYKELPSPSSEPPVLTLTEKNGFVHQSDRFHKRLATEDVSKYKVVRRNDIAFNPYLLWAGAVAQNTIVDEGIISPLYPTFKVRNGFDPRYVARLLLSPQMISVYDTIAFGSVPRRRRSSVSDFLALEITDPPSLDEQRRIAAILDHTDNLRAKRRRITGRLDPLKQAIYVNMFSHSDWPTIELAKLCSSPDDIRCGPFGTQLQKSEVVDHGVPLWGIKNVNSGFTLPPFEFLESATARRLNQYSVEPNDIVMTRKGTVGNCAVYPQGLTAGIMHSDLLRLRVDPERVQPAFVAHQLHFDPRVKQQMMAMSSGAVMPGLNVGRLKGLRVVAPPLEHQVIFAERMQELDKLVHSSDRHHHQLDKLFASLQARAFRGKL
ncbi:restriction endonuclease subunit S [Mycolicibacterium fortuitum]|uniref:Restriction endonuclease S subunit n=1 Tax=Mycolicibacterium fortuitum TaxID=1766 RepID=A0A378UVQ4_MYCFO|nr:restriction endonuclease subunit S [Mycolicibacterium fortuitum]CRL82198.1 EcoKI restriction-modification system protein HsdS [Mycolicibacter nonchromogenicus]WEV31170.1 restriction endonuclease subunit S [Mycolicibacterium fortuitum]CRL53712.1 EcoKI restriction-modification system protein HsdS [Mycolicibacterium fortuitum subsp. fortuitum DSM 46621 = ATCC 6841 = JCM 6387]STZ88149.1 restriction endonuclease S subunit [Mycolicibacterium fortuitum]BDE00149.1 hypothetical protein MFTT_42420 [M